jgi:hypothetical protein
MGQLRIMTRHGDACAEWDSARATAGDAESRAAVAEAERIFAEQRARGATAFVVARDRPARVVARFDPEAEQIVIVPQIAGG